MFLAFLFLFLATVTWNVTYEVTSSTVSAGSETVPRPDTTRALGKDPPGRILVKFRPNADLAEIERLNPLTMLLRSASFLGSM